MEVFSSRWQNRRETCEVGDEEEQEERKPGEEEDGGGMIRRERNRTGEGASDKDEGAREDETKKTSARGGIREGG